jgi:uncharacterized protein (DUF924 family)
MAAKNAEAQAVLDYWNSIGPKGWWRRDDKVDADIRSRFGELHTRAAGHELDSWRESADDCLALVILLDQFSRNLHRGDGRAFACDAYARELADHALRAAFDAQVDPALAHFFYLPFMHSEEIGDQYRCVRLFHAAGGGDALKFAILHRDIIQRFGRFPHRNKALGRPATPAETAYLDSGGFSA